MWKIQLQNFDNTIIINSVVTYTNKLTKLTKKIHNQGIRPVKEQTKMLSHILKQIKKQKTTLGLSLLLFINQNPWIDSLINFTK